MKNVKLKTRKVGGIWARRHKEERRSEHRGIAERGRKKAGIEQDRLTSGKQKQRHGPMNIYHVRLRIEQIKRPSLSVHSFILTEKKRVGKCKKWNLRTHSQNQTKDTGSDPGE